MSKRRNEDNHICRCGRKMAPVLALAMLSLVALSACDLSKFRRQAADETAGTQSSEQTAEPGFPVAGDYDVVTTSEMDGKREESETFLDVSTAAKFEKKFAMKDGSNCREQQWSLSAGNFHSSAVCDAPDGDIHNIGGDVIGSFDEGRIDLTATTTLWGAPIREMVSYRLRPKVGG